MFKLTEEQKLLVETTKRLMKKEITPVADQYRAKGEPMPKDVIQELVKKTVPLGIMGNVIPQEHGGAGMDYLTWGLVYEQIDRAINSVIMISSGVAKSISVWGTDEQRAKYLPDLLSADKIGCTAITEPNVGSNPAMIETRAFLDKNHYVLNGTKVFITNAGIADIAIVVASLDRSKGAKGLARFIVDKKESPFEVRTIKTLAGESSLGELIFTDCRVPKENLIGESNAGLKDTMRGFQAARCFVGMGAVHICQQALEYSIQYAKERKQFGKPIGSFQLIQEMIAEMAAETEAARLLVYKALSVIDAGLFINSYSSMAKFYATEAAVRVTSKAVQIHGAYGLTTEYPIEGLFRLARMTTIPDGTTEIQKLVIGRELTGLRSFD
ncbi:MAG: acyl-CoA dehydrogenase family protein [Syntrophomonadaceae bacterium]